MPQEKRRYPRLERNIPVKISSDHGDILTETKNLSCFGAFCRMPQRLEPMTKLKIHLLLPLAQKGKAASKKVTCEGVVVRAADVPDAEGHFDTAIFFNSIAPKEIRSINEFINSMMEKSIQHGQPH